MRTPSRHPRLPHCLPSILSILGCLSAFADPINIANSSFEADNVTGNTLGGNPPANWSQDQVDTVFPYQATGAAFCINKAHTNVKPPVPLPDESDKMAMIRFDVILHQTLTTKIEPNTTYTLQVDAALRAPTPVEPTGATIRLGTGATADTNLLTPDTAEISVLKADGWVLWQATFTTGDTVPDDFLRVEVYWPRQEEDGDPQGLFDNVRLDAAPATASGFQLTITPAVAPEIGYDLEWESQAGKLYNLRTSPDLTGAIAGWDLVAGGDGIAATPPGNRFNVVPDLAKRFYAVEEFDAPPLFSENFEAGDGGFTVVTVEGSAWERGAPDSSGLGGTVDAGNNGSANAWATNLGTFSSAGGSPTAIASGFYANPTHTALRSPVIDLTEVAGARLIFAEAMDLPSVDTAIVNLINATTDDVIAQIHVSVDQEINNDATWNDVGPIDLAAGVGQEVRIEWRLQGTGGNTFDFMGWYIDDVVVTETP